MRTQLEQRLADLRSELEKGETILADLKTKEANLKESMLRIQGAIQVLEEELSRKAPAEKKSPGAKKN